MPCKFNHNPTIGIALGGGGAKGFAHIHIIKALEELGIEPAIISGTSMGALIGSAYASGMSACEIKDYTIKVFSSKVGLFHRLWGSMKSDISSILNRSARSGTIDMVSLVSNFLPTSLPSGFCDLSIPLAVVATDLNSGEDVVLRDGDLRTALAASACIPSIFQPVVLNGRNLIDGSTSNPVPIEPLLGLCDIIIAVDVTGVTPVPELAITTQNVLDRASQILQRTIVSEKISKFRPEIVIRPSLHGYKSLDFMRVAEIIEATAALEDRTKMLIENAITRIELSQ